MFNLFFQSPVDWAIDYGQWKILFAAMGNKTRTKVNDERRKVEKQRGIVDKFLARVQVQSSHFMDGLLATVIAMIENFEPISDDILLLCWKFEMSKNKFNKSYDPLTGKLWTVINKTMNDVLTIPVNKRKWFWFKEYLFESTIWYEDGVSRAVKEKIELLKKQEKNKLICQCKCGATMKSVIPAVVYGSAANCDICGNIIEATSKLYHCPEGANKTHPHGFDFCVTCAVELFTTSLHTICAVFTLCLIMPFLLHIYATDRKTKMKRKQGIIATKM